MKRSPITTFFIIFATIILDQWTKYAAFNYLISKEVTHMPITSFFNLVIVFNYGVSFGLFNTLPQGQFILSFIAIIIVIFLLFWLYKCYKFHVCIALSLIIGGALGNIIDRVRLGAVADFLDFYIGKYHWPAFNLADCTVFIGVFILIVDSFINRDEEKNDAIF